MSVQALLIVGVTLFCTGLYGVLTRRNAIAILMSIELMLNAANINLVTVARVLDHESAGQVMAIFIIALAACEAVVGLAIMLAVFRHSKSIFTDELQLLRG
jgi:NADH-quinone oxidoreductase subunit K